MTEQEKLKSIRELIMLAQNMMVEINKDRLDKGKNIIKAKVWESDYEGHNVDWYLMISRLAVEDEVITQGFCPNVC